jgi:hypothetical protein
VASVRRLRVYCVVIDARDRADLRLPSRNPWVDLPTSILPHPFLIHAQFVGGTTTFASACYIMALNPLLLSNGE